MNITLLSPKDETCFDERTASPGNPKDLSHLIPPDDWRLQRPALERMLESGLQFALGGGLAFSAYSKRCRSTKDVDLFVRPRDRHAFIRVLQECGFTDYHEQKEYDPSWIFRGWRDGAIVDVIWQMANHRAQVDDDWLSCGRHVLVHGTLLRVLPIEELIWAKLYVLQHDRCDWTDLLNLLHFAAEEVDWDHLLTRVDGDCELLGSVIAVYRWLCPHRSATIPDWVYFELGLRSTPPACADAAASTTDRKRLLDSREWFGEE